jgi:hypothetical protein
MSNAYEGNSNDLKTPGVAGTFTDLGGIRPLDGTVTTGVGVCGVGGPGYGVVGYVGIPVAPLSRPGAGAFPAAPNDTAGVDSGISSPVAQ